MVLVKTNPTSANQKKFIGIDLHTNNFFAHYLTTKGMEFDQQYPLSEKGFSDFFKTISKRDQIAVESTGNTAFFYRNVESKVSKITIVASRNFKIISESSKKTDKNDAKALAYYLSKGMLPEARLKSPKVLELGSLITTRFKLVGIRTALINRTHSILNAHGFKIAKSRLNTQSGFKKYVFDKEFPALAKLELDLIFTQVNLMNQNILRLSEEIEKLASTLYGYKNLTSILGIGSLSAAILLSVIDEINDFPNHKKLSSYFGIAPAVKESNGVRQASRISKRGSKIGRCTLVRCSFVAKRYNPYLGEFYERIKARSGSKKAAVACANKLIKIIFNALKNDWIFDDFSKFDYHIRDNNLTI